MLGRIQEAVKNKITIGQKIDHKAGLAENDHEGKSTKDILQI